MVPMQPEEREATRCTNCGNAITPGMRFCGHCGRELSGLVPDASVRHYADEAQGGWELRTLAGPDSGRRFALGVSTRLGRSPENEIHLSDPQTSRRHALLEQSAGRCVLSDLGSRNGTFVNGARIVKATRLQPGDTIRIGDTTLRVEAHAHAEPPVATPAHPSPSVPVPPSRVADVPPADLPLSSEPVVGVIPGVERRRGVLGSETFNLIVTSQRLVFALLTSEMPRAAAARANQKAKSEGRGLLGQWGAVLRTNSEIIEQYYQTPVETILRQQPGAFFIHVQHVRRVDLRSNSDPGRSVPDVMVIHAAEKTRFYLRQTTAAEAKKVLRQVLGRLVR